MADKDILTGEHFIHGDAACAEGGIAAGCRFFAGYPITPATEVAERMARRLPQVGGVYIQMEDEIASMAAILGASWGGVKSMTSTSGPGFSLMMENIGLGMMTETPCVVVNIQRGGPSTGLPTLVGQADVMQARWGSHGDYGCIALAPSSPQECFDFTVDAFNLSEIYRQPVFVLGDEVVGHMTEKVIIPPRDKLKIVDRKKPQVSKQEYLPFATEDLMPAPMAVAGQGYHVHVTGLTHDERGYPVITDAVQERNVRHIVDKIRKNAEKIIRYDAVFLDDAEVVVVAYGCTSRVARQSVEDMRAKGVKAGLLRLITLWPFPSQVIRRLAKQAKAFVVPEINYGQIAYEVERTAQGNAEVVLMALMGGSIHTPEEITETVLECL
ncbi:2-oxoacid:acceptor oxidoreductase subunit alpha [Desulfomonile tiedjei]|uniref:2-oxoacid:ferredoxin oxidoreductase, alpha subunit n=1 Tax=Desulfomonile tiedjei (strain ATCC 49306 / DSM 6799 / DCB-1) TaxID=706587 RepID=I4BZM4_DESTA|nr:2-oxoacid:acceptor oxidoreductase subunit alpha [Desulfomonile tiedjei]AFM22765.1 2-oxoacid:ferredoxin oxidoreductase, alpha subunit [Desulfomonile tiedjei DSM 6799]